MSDKSHLRRAGKSVKARRTRFKFCLTIVWQWDPTVSQSQFFSSVNMVIKMPPHQFRVFQSTDDPIGMKLRTWSSTLQVIFIVLFVINTHCWLHCHFISLPHHRGLLWQSSSASRMQSGTRQASEKFSSFISWTYHFLLELWHLPLNCSLLHLWDETLGSSQLPRQIRCFYQLL